jgi:hypothetical protein
MIGLSSGRHSNYLFREGKFCCLCLFILFILYVYNEEQQQYLLQVIEKHRQEINLNGRKQDLGKI